MTISLRTYNILKWLLFIAAVFFIVSLLLFGAYFGYDKKYSDKYFPGTKISGMEIGGLSRIEAEKKLNEKIDTLKKTGVIFAYFSKQSNLDLLPASSGADIALPIAQFELEKAMNEAYDYPREKNYLVNIRKRMGLWNSGKDFPLEVSIQNEMIEEFLSENFSDFSTPAQNASLVISTSTKYSDTRFEISEEVNGQVLDFSKALNDLRERMLRLDNSIIFLEMSPEYPNVFKKDCIGAEQKAEEAIAMAPLKLTYKKDSWDIVENDLLSMIELKTRVNASGTKEAFIGLNFELGTKFLDDSIAKEIDQEAIDAKFEVVDGRVQKFQAQQDGIALDREDTIRRIEEMLYNNKKEDIELNTKIVVSSSADAEMESFGLTEIIGTGHSNFAGSPNNRRHNIKIGAASVNGSLIAPGEEFSLLKTLGKIEASTGYLPELVIKEGKTLPEYGGGLCQIGTTVFRGTVKSGLPVTMRRNHSYRVGYYEPAGTDATIYDPWPDYKFKNDTKHHVLIQSRIEGNDLYFDFWGTNDGRVATSTYPTIYNIVKPGPTKMIETLSLKPGEKKCTESAHNGADAYFDYKVTYPDGRVEDTRFKSHYVPWQAVCLIGVDKLTADKEKEAAEKKAVVPVASSTGEVIAN